MTINSKQRYNYKINFFRQIACYSMNVKFRQIHENFV